MAKVILQTVPLAVGPWPTIDPFLFCVHHHDDYPIGNEQLGPVASLANRDIGQDFSGQNGWSMYHGDVVPGFPQHPHRGFETVTFVRNGLVDHSDSLGATARFGRGDVQWMTAGAGIVHSEMFPLVYDDQPNPLELFQIWVNLPQQDKMVDPYFTMLWNESVPRQRTVDAEGRVSEITVVAGSFAGLPALTPPPNSWASRSEADVAIWHVHLDPRAGVKLPMAQHPDLTRVLYFYDGSKVNIDGDVVTGKTAVVVRSDEVIDVVAGDEPVELLLLQGRPIGEPVVQHGPFVMNDQAGIEQAFRAPQPHRHVQQPARPQRPHVQPLPRLSLDA